MHKPFPAYEGDGPYVFVCYAHEDDGVVYPEIGWLREQGINVWYDEGIAGGKIWREEIGNAIKEASEVLYYISGASLTSDHCSREIHFALDHHIDVLPVYLEDVPLTTDLEVGLSRVQALFRSQDSSYRQHLLDALGPKNNPPRAKVEKNPTYPWYGRVLIGSLAVLLLGSGWYWLQSEDAPVPQADSGPATAPEQTSISIAVLPFTNLSSEPDSEYFSFGITDELINVLSGVPGLKVSSRTSSFSIANKGMDLRGIASQLGVQNVLEGSVRRSGDNVRITVQLIDASADSQRWSSSYDRELKDILGLQGEISLDIANALRLTLVDDRPLFPGTVNEDAYDNYLRGLHFQMQNLDWLKARDYFEEAVRLDPGYAPAQAHLAEALFNIGGFRELPPMEVYPIARAAALRAVELDPQLPDAHNVLGWSRIMYWEGDGWVGAEQAFRHAITLDPSYWGHHHGLGWVLAIQGRLDEALAAARRAHDLSPLDWWPREGLAQIYLKRREYDELVKQQEIVMEMNPGAVWAAKLGRALAWTGSSQRALDYADRAVGLEPGNPNIELWTAVVHTILGDEARAREILERAVERSEQEFVSPGVIAYVYANLGESDQAFLWLERAVDAYDSMVFMLNYPGWDPIRTDPRFTALLVRLGLPGDVYQ